MFIFWATLGTKSLSEDEIYVSKAQQDSLRAKWYREFHRAPTQAEFANLVKQWVKDEIAVREALALQLDRGDPVIRRRLIQKHEYFIEAAFIDEVEEQQLRAHYSVNAERFTRSALFTFSHYFFSKEHRSSPLSDALAALADASSGKEIIGDSFIQANQYRDATPSQLREVFGAEFADQLASESELVAPETGASFEWLGPITSSFGYHLVRLEAFTPAQVESFEEAYEQVVYDFNAEKSRKGKNRVFDSLLQGYAVVLE